MNITNITLIINIVSNIALMQKKHKEQNFNVTNKHQQHDNEVLETDYKRRRRAGVEL